MRTRSAAIVATVVALVLSACGGSGAADPLREGRTVYGDVCSACHGSDGGGGIGPSLATVTETWPSCDDQVEWIALGSEGWKARHGPTYGAPAHPVNGGMPAHGDSLTDEEIRLVAAWERVTYGGQTKAEALADCAIPTG